MDCFVEERKKWCQFLLVVVYLSFQEYFLQCILECLFVFNGFEQGFEVVFVERVGIFMLNDFKEYGWVRLNWFSENLQQVVFIVVVYQDVQFLQWCKIFFDFFYLFQ